jgi:DNA-binding transcriptional MerR regulator
VAKGPEAFRTISEAAEELNTPQHVLRFWETRFSFIRPMKRAGGRRFYRPQDITVLRGVKTLLHVHGYSIKGVQKLHKDEGLTCLIEAAAGRVPQAAVALPGLGALIHDAGSRAGLLQARADLVAVKQRLDALLASH